VRQKLLCGKVALMDLLTLADMPVEEMGWA